MVIAIVALVVLVVLTGFAIGYAVSQRQDLNTNFNLIADLMAQNADLLAENANLAFNLEMVLGEQPRQGDTSV